MKVLVLGCGMQGRAVIFDLLKSNIIRNCGCGHDGTPIGSIHLFSFK